MGNVRTETEAKKLAVENKIAAFLRLYGPYALHASILVRRRAELQLVTRPHYSNALREQPALVPWNGVGVCRFWG
jgi:hypothetical protein